METVRSMRVNGAEKNHEETSCERLMISDILDQSCLDLPVNASGNTMWFFELIRTYQDSPALVGAKHQTWSAEKVGNGRLQILCRDKYGDILIARLVRKRIPFPELKVILLDN